MILVGPSGCGKSTALRMIAGLEDISDGDLVIDGERVNDLAPRDRDIAMVFQNYALYPHMTVRDNMGFALKLAKDAKEDIDRRVNEAAKILDLEQHLERKPANLSGGQRQRVAMGRAIVRSPKAFLMDEPLSNLDAKLRVQMRTEVARIQQRLGTTTVYVTHDQTEAMTLGDRVAVMRGGIIQQVAPAEGALRAARQPVRGRVHRLAVDELRPRAPGGRHDQAPVRRRRAPGLDQDAHEGRRGRGHPRRHRGRAAGALRGRAGRARQAGPAVQGAGGGRRVDGLRALRLLRRQVGAGRVRRARRARRGRGPERPAQPRRRRAADGRPPRRPPRRRRPAGRSRWCSTRRRSSCSTRRTGRSLACRATDADRAGAGPRYFGGLVRRLVVLLLAALAAPPPRPAAGAAERKVPFGFLGTMADGAFVEQPALPLDAEAQAMVRTGVERLRLALYWDQAQPDPALAPDFAATERMVGAAARRGIPVFLTIVRRPAVGAQGPGARPGRRPPTRPPTAASPARSPRASAAAARSGPSTPSCRACRSATTRSGTSRRASSPASRRSSGTTRASPTSSATSPCCARRGRRSSPPTRRRHRAGRALRARVEDAAASSCRRARTGSSTSTRSTSSPRARATSCVAARKTRARMRRRGRAPVPVVFTEVDAGPRRAGACARATELQATT